MNIGVDILFASSFSSSPRLFDGNTMDSGRSAGKTMTGRGLKTLGRSSSMGKKEKRFGDTKFLNFFKFS
jgi:hypothetical protein